MAIKVSGTEVISDDKRILNNESLPDIRPSLLLDFANSKTLDPRITFTRGSTATYWDGKTTAKAEENLLRWSQDFTNGLWFVQGAASKTANAASAPDGTTTAGQISMSSGTNSAFFGSSNNNITSGITYTFSVYVKQGSGIDYIQLTSLDSTSSRANFDISTGSLGTVNSDSTSNITDVGNGWYRLEWTFPALVTDTADALYVIAVNSSTSGKFDTTKTWAGTESYYIWGAQLEQRSSATAYTPTTSSPIVKYQPVLQTAASGEARFDHDPVTGESKGLLIEEARTNLITESVVDDTAYWNLISAGTGSTPVRTLNQGIAPDGTQTAAQLQFDLNGGDTSSDRSILSHNAVSGTNGTDYTSSVWLKSADGTSYDIHISISGVAAITATVTDEWQRFDTTLTYSTFTMHTRIGLQGNRGNSDTANILVWGAQLEEGSFPTSYIPTSGSTVTRAKDYAKFFYDDSGWNEQESTIYADVTIEHDLTNSYPRILEVSASFILSGQDVNDLAYFQGSIFGEYPTVNSAANSFTLGRHKIAASFKNHVGFSLSVDGDLNTQSGVNFRVPTPSGRDFMILSNTAHNRYLSGYISKLAIYPKRLPNATLQAMTEA